MRRTSLKKSLLRESRLYCIVDGATSQGSPVKAALLINRSGAADIVQYRDKLLETKTFLKQALLIKRIFSKTQTLFIINDRVDIALAIDADGVHIGQDDLPVKLARKIIGPNKIIGVSCHSFEQALKAQREGADYIGFGPIFSTPTKPEYKAIGKESIGRLCKKLRIPFFAIGSINQDNLAGLIKLQAKRIAVCRPACTGDIKKNLLKLNSLLDPKK